MNLPTLPPTGPSSPASPATAPVFPGGTAAPPRPATGTVRILRAAGHPLRWQMLVTLARDGPRSAITLAKELRSSYAIVTKNLNRLRAASAVDSRPDTDRRMSLYFIPPHVLRDTPDGERLLDYGHCLLRPGLFLPPPAARPPPLATLTPPPDDGWHDRIMP